MESFEEVTAQYKAMIYSIIQKLHIYKNKDEYFQAGLIALWEAQQRFDPQKGRFTSFAYTYIKGRILSELTDRMKDQDYCIQAKEELFENREDACTTIPLEEDILLSYCTTAQLTENQTKWVLYTFLKGFSTQQIAEIENVSRSAVKAWRTGAKDRLRKQRNGSPVSI